MTRHTIAAFTLVVLLAPGSGLPAQQAPPQRPNQDSAPPRNTQKPPLHGRHWVAVTGKPLGAAAGARIFQQGGNAIDAACAMLAAVTASRAARAASSPAPLTAVVRAAEAVRGTRAEPVRGAALERGGESWSTNTGVRLA